MDWSCLAEMKVCFRLRSTSMHGLALLVLRDFARWMAPFSLIADPAKDIAIGFFVGICLMILSASVSFTLSPKYIKFSYFCSP